MHLNVHTPTWNHSRCSCCSRQPSSRRRNVLPKNKMSLWLCASGHTYMRTSIHNCIHIHECMKIHLCSSGRLLVHWTVMISFKSVLKTVRLLAQLALDRNELLFSAPLEAAGVLFCFGLGCWTSCAYVLEPRCLCEWVSECKRERVCVCVCVCVSFILFRPAL
jgi:hypothetical protein